MVCVSHEVPKESSRGAAGSNRRFVGFSLQFPPLSILCHISTYHGDHTHISSSAGLELPKGRPSSVVPPSSATGSRTCPLLSSASSSSPGSTPEFRRSNSLVACPSRPCTTQQQEGVQVDSSERRQRVDGDNIYDRPARLINLPGTPLLLLCRSPQYCRRSLQASPTSWAGRQPGLLGAKGWAPLTPGSLAS